MNKRPMPYVVATTMWADHNGVLEPSGVKYHFILATDEAAAVGKVRRFMVSGHEPWFVYHFDPTTNPEPVLKLFAEHGYAQGSPLMRSLLRPQARVKTQLEDGSTAIGVIRSLGSRGQWNIVLHTVVGSNRCPRHRVNRVVSRRLREMCIVY